MTQIKAVNARQLRSLCSEANFQFSTTEEIPELKGMVGQQRAEESLSFGVEIERDGYNMYLMGSTGLGKLSLLRQFLDKASSKKPVANDWCYVFNFDDPQKPKAITLPPGKGRIFRDSMKQLIHGLQTSIPAAFESEQYYIRQQELRDSLQEKIQDAFDSLNKEARDHDVAIFRKEDDLTFTPLLNDKAMSQEEYTNLSEKEKSQFEEVIAVLEERLQNVFRQRSQWQKEVRDKQQEINREVGMFAAQSLIEEVRNKFSEFESVINHLTNLQEDLIESLYYFQAHEHSELVNEPLDDPFGFQHYEVNLVVDNGSEVSAPVIHEDNPTHQNILGKVEYVSQMGTQVTDFRFIKPGALHRANGGYLILDAQKILGQPFAWETIKRTLVAKEINIQSAADSLGLFNMVSLEPEAIPLDIKIIMVGSRSLFYLLEEYDAEFPELFKIEVDFSESIESNTDTLNDYAQVIAALVRKNELKAFDKSAVIRVIEYGMRLIEDSKRLSMHMNTMLDLLIESDYLAGKSDKAIVSGEHVKLAIEKQVYRGDRSRERIYDEIARGTVLIDVTGEKVASVNGLFVIEMGRIEYSQPARITATVRVGDGDIVDIEREVDLGGSLHSKGVLILSSYLGSYYATGKPLSLAASLVFEQSYGNVDGDSATVGEFCALISAISGVPVKQSFAITGSADQQGNVQAIGGVNEKIEGFFDICKLKGLTGEQGVIIPEPNLPHLVLRDDVIEAVENNQFNIYPVNTVNQAISLITGKEAGERNEKGEFPENTVNQLTEKRLLELAEMKHDEHNKDEQD